MLKPEIGKTAGMVRTYLAKNGKCSLTNLQYETKIMPDRLDQAIGWLARENKIHLTQESEDEYICLTEKEIKNYRARPDDDSAECGARL